MSVSWLIRADGNSPPHKCCLHHWFYSNVKHFGFTLFPLQTVKEGDTVTFFIQDLGFALVAKTCPHRPQAIKKSKNSHHAFPYEKRTYQVLFFFFFGTPWIFARVHVHPRDLTSEGAFFFFRWIYLVVIIVRMYTCIKCLEEECRITNESGSCTLRPPRLLPCCFPLHRRQISSDIKCSRLFVDRHKT